MQCQTDILLIAPPLLWEQETRLDMKQPINLLYLASWLNEHNLRAQVIDVISAALTLQEVLPEIAAVQPRFVGIPFYQATRETALTLCREIRRRFPEIWIVAGGPLVTTFYTNLQSQPEIDICIIGEGEITLTELLTSQLNGPRTDKADLSCLAGIPGLAYMEGNHPVFTGRRSPIENLDNLPFLDFRLIDIDAYFAYHASIDMSSWLFLTTSRGCHCRCTFCATPVLWPDGLRRQSVPRLLAEIVHQRQLFPQAQFGFMDDSFFTDKAWLREFFSGIKQLKVKYCCIGRADHLEAADVQGLADSGCIYVAMGIETGNQARQKTLKKYLDLNRVRNSVRLLAQHQIFCKGFFMLGFPDETPEEMLETINLAIELKKLGMGECNFFPVSIYPGTELAEQCAETTYTSTVYQQPGKNSMNAIDSVNTENGSSIGETKLLRYANIPDSDVNRYFSKAQLLEIIKLAYRKADSGEQASLAEFPQC